MLGHGEHNILITRMSPDAAQQVGEFCRELEYHPLPKVGLVRRRREITACGPIAVVSGGTSDLPVCEEAALTAEALGNEVDRIYDVGVAGVHRLLSQLDRLMKARVVIAVAGMEGALASVVGGLVDCPSLQSQPASATAHPFTGCRHFSRCSIPAPAASASSTSTTALGRAIWPA